jgi:hypothetical protein
MAARRERHDDRRVAREASGRVDFHDDRVGSVAVERGIPSGGRRMPSRWSPGAFTGQIVEHRGPPS